MYEHFFGLKETPFRLTPDTDFYYAYPDHQEAMNVLLVALSMGEGFIKITGEVGTGKTLVCRKLLNTLTHKEVYTLYLPNPSLSPEGLLDAIAEELRIKRVDYPDSRSIQQAISAQLIKFRAQQRPVVLIVDEAQTIPLESLEAIRLLTNLETEKHKLLQVVLFGQPELDCHLQADSVRQIRQRITFCYQIKPMHPDGVAAYLQHRLTMAGRKGGPLFSPRVLRRFVVASRGIPRLINILAHKAMLSAYGEGSERVKIRHLERAVRDTEDATQPLDWPRWLWPGVVGLGLSSAVGAATYLIIGGGA